MLRAQRSVLKRQSTGAVQDADAPSNATGRIRGEGFVAFIRAKRESETPYVVCYEF